MIGIGTKLWYASPRREWVSCDVIGETAQSWLVSPGWKPRRINKKTMLMSLGKYGAERYYTGWQKEEKIWRDVHRFVIAKAVEGCEDVAILQRIADMVGKKL